MIVVPISARITIKLLNSNAQYEFDYDYGNLS